MKKNISSDEEQEYHSMCAINGSVCPLEKGLKVNNQERNISEHGKELISWKKNSFIWWKKKNKCSQIGSLDKIETTIFS